MPLVTTKEMFEKAVLGKYAIGAFNVNNMELIQAITEAASEEKSPVILQVSAGARNYAKQSYLMKLIEAALIETDATMCIHLDHGEDFEICKNCIDGGFTSVMIDGSKYSYSENIELTKRVVEYAHQRGVVVEAELGRLAGVEDNVSVSNDDALYTDPCQALEFIGKTGCDSLAIAIGTSHGAYKFKSEPKLRFDILEKIKKEKPDYPIVLHGASSVVQQYVRMCNDFGGNLPGALGVPEDMLRQAAYHGVCKINIDSDLRLAMTGSIRKFLVENPGEFDPRKYLGVARNNIKELVRHKMRDVLGSSGKI